MLLVLLIQAAAPEAAPTIRPDIELNIRARARSVEIERKGEARLAVRAEPDAGSRVEVRVDPAPEGRTQLRDVRVELRAQARVGEGADIDAQVETAGPQ
ncbi:MAG TPA: hypothetical protein VEZ70_03210 [Allosphingosinicella sp.]|nr:hypothetical protein [Allosphingosinicella sp.]